MKITLQQQYQVKKQYEIEAIPLSSYTNVEHFKGGDSLFMVEVKTVETRTGFYNDSKEEVWKKTVSSQLLDAILKEPHNVQSLEKKFTIETPVFLVNPKFLEIHTRFGHSQSLMKLETGQEFHKAEHLFKGDIFNKELTKEAIFIQLVENKTYSQIFKDSHNNFYCEPFIIEYIKGINNKDYDLEPMIEHLMKRDDVAFMVGINSYKKGILLKAPLTGDEPDISRIIEDIPSYNASEEETEFFTLVYYPKDVSQILAFDHKNSDYNRIEAFILEDILDCKQFKKIPVEEEVVTVKRKFKR